MWNLNKKDVSFGLNQINGYLRRGLNLERFDPSRGLIEPRIWIYAGLKTCRNFLTNTIIILIFINLKHVFTLL